MQREFVFIIYLSVLIHNVKSTPNPEVETDVGVIRGLTASDGEYNMFMGIPYATVNSTNPFGESIPYPVFENVLEAYNDSAKCPQLIKNTTVGTLDCLHLNIYVPLSATSTNRLPVMVWIHGGAYTQGSSGRETYGPKYIVKHDVILVTLNYRLDAYGFMCLDIPEVPGNQGLKDQFIAIKWVKDNIEAFGGDVDKITLFGESAGGHSIDLHLLSTKEKLYNNVILQSGSAVAASVLYEPDKSAPIKMSQYLGFESDDIYEAISYLTQVDADLVTKATKAVGIIFKPCVEKQFDGVEPFISNEWINTKVPKVEGVPVLLGFMENELAVIHANKGAEHFKNLNIVETNLKRMFNFSDEKLSKIKTDIHHFYFGDEEINENLKLDVTHFDSDYTYIHPILRTIRNYLESEAGDIFYYMFSYIGGLNAISGYAAHADDNRYLFDMSTITVDPTSDDQVVIDRLTTMWTNFAKYSDPTPNVTELLPVKWQPLTKDVYNYLHIDTELNLRRRPLHQRMAFWDLFYDLNQEFQNGYEKI